MFRTTRLLSAALAAVLAAACGGSNPQADTDIDPNLGSEGYAVVKVENNNTSDMRVYLRPGGGAARFRLGTANALTTTTLRIPRTMVTGVTDLTFEIVPLAGSGRAFSERITARPGEEILLRISP